MTPEMNWPGMIAISTDYGLTWNAAQTPEPCGAVLEFAFSLSDPNWIYANGYAYNHVELLRSRDGGFTWEDITPEFPIWGYTVAVNPTNPEIVFIAAYETIYRSTDGGESWMEVASYGDVRSMLYTPTNPPALYLGSNGLWRSLDDGLTWTLAEGLLGDGSVIVRKLAFSQDAERSVLYVGVVGLIDTSQSIAQSMEDTQAAVGVYRNARLLPSVRLYLPFVMR
jgi:photosystem II stability/assembly factor-like uncharacterized protein